MDGLLLLVWFVTCMDLGMHHTSTYVKTFRLAVSPIFTDRGLVINTSCAESSFPQSSTSRPLILRVTSSSTVVFLWRSQEATWWGLNEWLTTILQSLGGDHKVGVLHGILFERVAKVVISLFILATWWRPLTSRRRSNWLRICPTFRHHKLWSNYLTIGHQPMLMLTKFCELNLLSLVLLAHLVW